MFKSLNDDLNNLISNCYNYLNLYENLWKQLVNTRNPYLTNKEKIAEEIYFDLSNNSKFNKKLKQKDYYRANLSAFQMNIKDILERLKSDNLEESAVRKLRSMIPIYITDSLILINNYYYYYKNDSPIFSLYRSSVSHYSSYYDTCEQIIFGEIKSDNLSDQSEITPPLIRLMIELRLKRGMGILSFEVSNYPGSMNQILEIYRSFPKHQLTVLPRFDLVEKIYKWANTYIHTGVKQYIWLTGFAINLLEPLFYGNRDEDHNLSGIQVESLATIYQFWNQLKNYKADADVKIYSCNRIECTNYDCYPLHKEDNYNLIFHNILSILDLNKDEAIIHMKFILKKGSDFIGDELYEHVKNSYVYLRKKEIQERAYYIWENNGKPLGSADENWYKAIEKDICS